MAVLWMGLFNFMCRNSPGISVSLVVNQDKSSVSSGSSRCSFNWAACLPCSRALFRTSRGSAVPALMRRFRLLLIRVSHGVGFRGRCENRLEQAKTEETRPTVASGHTPRRRRTVLVSFRAFLFSYPPKARPVERGGGPRGLSAVLSEWAAREGTPGSYLKRHYI